MVVNRAEPEDLPDKSVEYLLRSLVKYNVQRNSANSAESNITK